MYFESLLPEKISMLLFLKYALLNSVNSVLR